MSKRWINGCRDVLHVRLLGSIVAKIINLSFCRDALHGRLLISKSTSLKIDARIERLYNYKSMWIIINLQILQKTNFKYIPNNKMSKRWINGCRDVLHVRLLGSIVAKIINLSFCRDVLYARLMVLNAFQQSIHL